MLRKWSALLLPVMMLAGAGVAMSGDLSLVSDRAFVVVQDADGSPSILNSLNLVTGELTPVGDIGFRVTALAFSKTGVLFGVDPELDVLVRIDPSKGVGMAVGPLGIDIGDRRGSDLTFDDDDLLWMMAAEEGVTGLYQIDQHTGFAEWSAPVEAPFGRALAAEGDRLYAANFFLGVINAVDGTMESIGVDGLDVFQPQWMSFGSGPTLWAVAGCGVCAAPWEVVDLVTVDLEAGVVALHQVGWLWGLSGVRGLAIQGGRRFQMVAPLSVD